MPYELKDIKEIRKKFNLTQSQLAKSSGVSQSLIAKIESGRLDPTYTNAQKIFSALDNLSKKNETKAEDILNKKIISVSPEDTVQDSIKKMKKYGISQLPVINSEKPVGYVSESVILESMMSKRSSPKIKDLMQESPPTIDKEAGMTVMSGLLKFYPMILVIEKGKIIGIITKSDLINKFSAKEGWSFFRR
jgi:predicted transcriptional regulator